MNYVVGLLTYNEEKVNSSETIENNYKEDDITQKQKVHMEEICDNIKPPVILLMNFPRIDSQDKGLKMDSSLTDTKSSSFEYELADFNLQSKNRFVEK